MSVKVAVRVRPFNQRQKFLGCLCCIKMKEKTTILINPRDRNHKQHQFTFDYSLWSHDGYQELENGYLYPIDDRFIDQKRIFKELGEDIITNAWNGFNCCLFAYGQTGAGKSYSMIGYESNKGIVPMACQKIFQGISKTQIKGKKQFEVTISMLEIYNQKVQDLFMHTSKRPPNGLRIRQNKKFGVYVQGITKYQVKSYHQIQSRMEEGAKHRSLAATLMNQYSSRAHTIVIIQFIQKQYITEQKINKKSSTLNLVDLAGSERIAKTGINNKDRLKQASQINKSLHTLGRVIQNLAEQAAGKGKNVAVPYRDSALTRILETALGGNSVTTMICAISPANDNYEETLSTLRYADQAKRIRNKPIINQSAVDKIIRQLRQQNERLKQMLRIAKLKGINLEDSENIQANIFQIQRQIRKTMHSFAINTDDLSNQDEQDYSNLMMTQFTQISDPSQFNPNQIIQISSFDTSLSSKTLNVYLTNLSEDPMLSYKIKYSCESQLYVGNKNLKQGGNNKLILIGLGIEDRHARIYQINDKYYIQSLSQHASQYTLINGRPIQKSQQLYHNDRVIFGTNSVFVFKNNNNIQMRKNTHLKIIPNNPNKVLIANRNRQQKQLNLNTNIEQKLKYKVQPINIRASFGNQSLLLEDLDDFDIVPKKQVYQQNRQDQFQSSNNQIVIAERDLDYQFAINERQSKLQNSTSFSSQIQYQNSNDQMAKKLEQIQKQFQSLMAENQRKMKQRQQEFQRQLRKVQKQKQRQRKKLIQELRNKEAEAEAIALEKLKIQKYRDQLKQKQIQKQTYRQSMLLQGYSEQSSPKIQTRVQYIDKHHHHFHYQYNQFPQTDIQIPTNFIQINQQQKQQETNNQKNYAKLQPNRRSLLTAKLADKSLTQQTPQHSEINTTNSTTMLNLQQQSMLLEQPSLKPSYSQQLKFKKRQHQTDHNKKIQAGNQFSDKAVIDSQIDPQEARIKFIEQCSKDLSIENGQTVTKSQVQIPHIQQQSKLKKQSSQPSRKKSSLNQLNISDILDNQPLNIKDSQSYREQQSNLLNNTNSNPLDCYISTKQVKNYTPQELNLPLSMQNRQSFKNVSLNLSEDDLSITQHLKEEQLNEKIKELQEKLKSLEQKQTEKKQNIKNIRKSFIQGLGQNPNSDNFYTNSSLEDDLEISMIKNHKDSSETDIQALQLQKKIRMKMVQCQNQNILNQRNLQVRKRKREADQLRQIYIKKQKRQIQKQLITLIPMLEKFNLWARQMNKNLQGKVSIQYRNFTNLQILDALKNQIFKSKIKIQIKIINYQEGRVYFWPTSVFENRYQILQGLFQKFLQNPGVDYFSDKYKDPFWQPKDFQPNGVSYLALQPLCYALSYEGQINFVHKGHIVAKMEVSISPNDYQSKLKQRFANQVITEEIHDPRQLLEKDIYFTLHIDKLTPTQYLQMEKIQRFYISYELIEDGYKSRVYKTPQFESKKLDIMYAYRHSFRNVTEHTLAYLADSPICFVLNAVYQFDDELSGMSSSFIHNDSSANLSGSFTQLNDSGSGGTKSNLSSVLSSSPQSFKKKQTVVFENTEIMEKIQKDYNSAQQKKAKAKKKEPLSQNRKKQKHNQKQCQIF